ncbi:hypothetical protein CMUS01_16815 [Colletotrichum musicola]|uniref:Uncharacterized protein n=1 Tax=Colletotrichum musicola TaxID=2175873 RepID=A0A8H6IL98_9PEZI|nr:hypothetical protein CMUS01_16815 [Colletotrichum musicola]
MRTVGASTSASARPTPSASGGSR